MDPEYHSEAGSSIAPSRLEGPGNGDTSAAGNKRTVRRDPEKRRQQNLQAQKKYREKLKKRLNHLETLAASVRDSVAASSAATPAADTSVALLSQGSPSYSTISDQHCHHHGSQEIHGAGSFDFTIDFFFNPATSSSKPAICSDSAPWDPTTSVDLSHLIHGKTTTCKSHYWVGLIDCGCARPHVQVSSKTSRDWGDMKILSIGPSFCPPDPYMNTLRIERICILEAIMANCLQIGITEQMFCGEHAISPFFRPGGNKAVGGTASDDTVTTVQRIFNTLKPDVRPIKEQVTMMHRPMIDVLPFPTFRKNLIYSGDAVHEEELYHDLLNGLVCWGGAGVGKKDRNVSTGQVSTGTPWDSRSWEARPWFLQKYWALLGGEDGELVRQSEWWRNMRGDEAELRLGC